MVFLQKNKNKCQIRHHPRSVKDLKAFHGVGIVQQKTLSARTKYVLPRIHFDGWGTQWWQDGTFVVCFESGGRREPITFLLWKTWRQRKPRPMADRLVQPGKLLRGYVYCRYFWWGGGYNLNQAKLTFLSFLFPQLIWYNLNDVLVGNLFRIFLVS